MFPEAVSIGEDPPREVNVVIEVRLAANRSNMSWTRRLVLWSSIGFSARRCATQETTGLSRTHSPRTAILAMSSSPIRGRFFQARSSPFALLVFCG